MATRASEPHGLSDGGNDATFNLTEAQQRERAEQEKLLAEFELRRQMKATVVPTDDGKVRQMLRALAEPVTLFGEREMERRDRLRRVLAQREADGVTELPGGSLLATQIVIEQAPVHKEKFFTEGGEQLKAARLVVAQWSLARAAARVRAAKRRHDDVDELKAVRHERTRSERAAKRLLQQCSEIGDDRPIGAAAISGDGALLAAAGWGGAVGLWRVRRGCSRAGGFRAHDLRATDVAWHPDATPGEGGGEDGGGVLALATGCSDGSAALWDIHGRRLQQLLGHSDRLGRIAFHPMGRHLATSSFDLTWRLWDVETGDCLVEQEGHSRAVYCVAFHPDGSLAGSGGLDAIGRIWDCRTGRSVHVLQGHVKQILAMDFSPDGYRLATGSDDHSVKVWDLRKRACVYTIPAHTSLVSAVRWQPEAGHYLLTAGYDCAAKVWSTRDWALLNTLSGHEGKIMAAALSPASEEHLVATTSYDRTIKLWMPESEEQLVLGGDDGDADVDMF